MYKNCSNCNSSNVILIQHGGKFQIGCKQCLKTTELKDTEKQAEQDWNKEN